MYPSDHSLVRMQVYFGHFQLDLLGIKLLFLHPTFYLLEILRLFQLSLAPQ